MRHVDPDTAQEVVAETFLVAWRRLRDVPGDPLPWLIVVARNTISNDRRSVYRARTLETELRRLASVSRASEEAPDGEVLERETMLRALATLTGKEREALLLLAWDGLSPAQAAEVLGCTTTAFNVRVHRARQRLRCVVDRDPEVSRSTDGPSPNGTSGPLRRQPMDLSPHGGTSRSPR